MIRWARRLPYAVRRYWWVFALAGPLAMLAPMREGRAPGQGELVARAAIGMSAPRPVLAPPPEAETAGMMERMQ